jgi:hypothetical protein
MLLDGEHMRRLSATLALVTTLGLSAAGTFLISSGAADAAPTCTTGYDRTTKPDKGWARCLTGGQHRVVVSCKASATATSMTRYYGPWVYATNTSTKYCPMAEPFLHAASYEHMVINP